jgi:hypothetical protein
VPRDDAADDRIEQQAELVAEFLAAHVEIAGDLAEIGAGVWAIHGHIPVDGEVILAEFDSFEQAHMALDRLPPKEQGDVGDP